jgi:hypothetical protein
MPESNGPPHRRVPMQLWENPRSAANGDGFRRSRQVHSRFPTHINVARLRKLSSSNWGQVVGQLTVPGAATVEPNRVFDIALRGVTQLEELLTGEAN